jgi:hypothetical protein
MNPLQEIINTLPLHIQTLYSDANIIATGHAVIATPERKKMVLATIKVLEDKLNEMKTHIGA